MTHYPTNTAQDFLPTQISLEFGDEEKSKYNAVPSYARWDKHVEVAAAGFNGENYEIKSEKWKDIALLSLAAITFSVAVYLLYQYKISP